MSVKISALQEQIPLYINGALNNEEKSAFEKALVQNPELKQEYKEFHEIESIIYITEEITDQHFEQLFTRIQANVKFAPPASAAKGMEEEATVIMRREDGIDKASQRIAETTPGSATIETPTESITVPQASVSEPIAPKVEHDDDEHISVFSKEYLSEFFTSARLAWGVVIAQFILLITLWLSSSANGINAVGTDGRPIADIATINIVFADQATQKEIRELLASVDAQIANGPTSIGLYTIYIKGNETDAKLVIDKLKKSTLILLAEPSFI